MKIMIIRAGALGDTLMLLPSINHIRAKAELVLVGRSPGIDYLGPYADKCLDYEGGGWHRLFIKGSGRDRSFPLHGADHITAFINDPEGIASENLSHLFSRDRTHIFSPFPPEREDAHIALYMARRLEEAGLPLNAREAFNDAFDMPLLKGQTDIRDRIVFHPGSGSIKKNYSPNLWIEIIASLRGPGRVGSLKTTILLGPAEEGLLPFFRDICNDSDTEILFCPEKEIILFTLARAVFYVGHDSGITHVAAMIGTPTIALFKTSLSTQWAPLGPEVRVLESEIEGTDFIDKIYHAAMSFLKKNTSDG